MLILIVPGTYNILAGLSISMGHGWARGYILYTETDGQSPEYNMHAR